MLDSVFTCEAPIGSAIRTRLPGAYFHDCHGIEVADTGWSALGYFLAIETPAWVESLMRLRNWLVQWVGLKNLGGFRDIDPDRPPSDYRPGERVGIFTLIANTNEEVLLGDDDRHLHVVVSVCKRPGTASGRIMLLVTTVVHVHNTLGRLYMLPVTPMHKLIAPSMSVGIAKAAELACAGGAGAHAKWNLFAALVERERRLHVWRQLPRVELDALLHEAFTEWGQSGKIYQKQDLLHAASDKLLDKICIESEGFRIAMVSDTEAVLTYHSAERLADGQIVRHASRESTWQYVDGRWQLFCHRAVSNGQKTGG